MKEETPPKTAEDVINRFINSQGVKFNQERDDWMLAAMEEYAVYEVERCEGELIDELLQKFESIGIDTSEWEYKFGDGNFAAEFIQAGISDYLERFASTPTSKQEGEEQREQLAKIVNTKSQRINELEETIDRQNEEIKRLQKHVEDTSSFFEYGELEVIYQAALDRIKELEAATQQEGRREEAEGQWMYGWHRVAASIPPNKGKEAESETDTETEWRRRWANRRGNKK